MRELAAAMVGFILGALAMLAVTGCAVVEYYDSDGALTKRAVAASPVMVFPTPDAPAVRVRRVCVCQPRRRGVAVGGDAEKHQPNLRWSESMTKMTALIIALALVAGCAG